MFQFFDIRNSHLFLSIRKTEYAQNFLLGENNENESLRHLHLALSELSFPSLGLTHILVNK